ncbi:hypothetical protein B0H19DRAFT_414683 [Mycena capillaripes]|nr:hypothetical protein B0H19DRAFT_414683 [Mycena capillaripes]
MSSDDPSTTQLLQLAMQRIERLEAEVATLKNVIYSGKTDIDVDLPVSVVETVEVPAATIEVVEVPAAIIEPAQEPAHEPAPSHRLAALPIRAWFHGSAPIHTRCYIAWDDNRPGLAVFSSDARATDGKTLPELELDLVRDVVSVHYTDPDDVRNRYPVVALVRRDGPNDGQQSQTQTQTQMTLALDSRDAEWSGARYRELIAWLQAQLCEKDCVGVFCCRSVY